MIYVSIRNIERIVKNIREHSSISYIISQTFAMVPINQSSSAPHNSSLVDNIVKRL